MSQINIPQILKDYKNGIKSRDNSKNDMTTMAAAVATVKIIIYDITPDLTPEEEINDEGIQLEGANHTNEIRS
jgi:vesicle coat complex subunit